MPCTIAQLTENVALKTLSEFSRDLKRSLCIGIPRSACVRRVSRLIPYFLVVPGSGISLAAKPSDIGISVKDGDDEVEGNVEVGLGATLRRLIVTDDEIACVSAEVVTGPVLRREAVDAGEAVVTIP